MEGWTPQNFIALGSVIIALVATLVPIYLRWRETVLERQRNKMNEGLSRLDDFVEATVNLGMAWRKINQDTISQGQRFKLRDTPDEEFETYSVSKHKTLYWLQAKGVNTTELKQASDDLINVYNISASELAELEFARANDPDFDMTIFKNKADEAMKATENANDRLEKVLSQIIRDLEV